MEPNAEIFPHSWTARILPAPPLIAPAQSFVFPQQIPGEEEAMGRGALLLDVRPEGGGNFLATCALGFQDRSLPSGLWSCPDPGELLAVAGGYAYRIPAADPARTSLLEQRPVVRVIAATAQNLLLLIGFHDCLALGAEGIRWRSGRLSWEGIQPDEIVDGTLRGTGWDMFADADRPFTLDLRTGQHTGGGYRAS